MNVGLSFLHCACSDHGSEGGEILQANRSGLLVIEFRGHFHQRLHGHGHEFGMAAIPAKAEIPSGSKNPPAFPAGIPATTRPAKSRPGTRGVLVSAILPSTFLASLGLMAAATTCTRTSPGSGLRLRKLFGVQVVQGARVFGNKDLAPSPPVPVMRCFLVCLLSGPAATKFRNWAYPPA